MPVHVEVRQARLTFRFLERECLAREQDADLVGAGGDGDAKFQVLVDRFVGISSISKI